MSDWDSPEVAETRASAPAPALIVVCIFAIVLGIAGVCGGVYGVAAVGMQGLLQDTVTAGMSGDQARAYDVLLAATATTKWIGVAYSLLNMLVAAGLIGGASLTLAKQSIGKRVFAVALFAAIALAVLQLVISIVNAFIMQQPMAEYMEASMGSLGGGAPAGMEQIAAVSMWVGILIGGAWVGVKVLFYVIGLAVLRRSGASDEDEFAEA